MTPLSSGRPSGCQGFPLPSFAPHFDTAHKMRTSYFLCSATGTKIPKCTWLPTYKSELPWEIQGVILLLKGRHLVLSEMPEGISNVCTGLAGTTQELQEILLEIPTVW